MTRLIRLLLAVSLVTPLAVAKSGPSFHTREQVDKARALCLEEDWAIKLREKAEASAAPWLAMSDEELWDLIPGADVPRALNVRFGHGCPICGKEVFAKGGHYPWIMRADKPFKVQCPVCERIFPSNDYEAYLKGGCKEKLDTTQEYVDDGFGWVDAEGNHYWFAAHYTFWQRWRKDVMSAISTLSYAYELTGDARYAHKTGVMLGRLAEVYPKMDYAKQAYHNGKWPAGINGRVLDYIWENSTIKRFAEAYDRVYDALGADSSLEAFLAERGITDLTRQYEQEVLHFMAKDVMEGRIRGNMYYQPTLATLAIIIDNDDPDYGPATEEMVDWLLYGGGEVMATLYNGFDRDGAGGESAPGYSSSWNNNFCKVADLLTRLGVDITADPRWKQVIRFPYNLTLCGKHTPRLGDCGGTIHAADKTVQAPVLTFGFKHFKDPQCAQLLLGLKVFGNSLWGDTLDRAEVEAVARSVPDRTEFGTRNLGGYGLGIFEAGEGGSRRAATLYYGSPEAWHGHHDRLTIDYWAHGRTFLPEMGYPAHWNDKGERFTRGMPCHYIVEIDEKRSANKKAGYLDFFAAGSRVRVMKAHAEAVYPDLAQTYARTFAMIDAGAESFLIDLFHVKGGGLHDYHFHGLPFGEFSTKGLKLTAEQEEGTLLGEDIPWGGDESKGASGYDFLRHVRRYAADEVWCASWAGREDARLAYWMPPPEGEDGEVIICDGEPPYKPDYPETMEFLMVRQHTEESVFPAVIAPGQATDAVKDVRFERRADGVTCHVDTAQGLWHVAIDLDGGFLAECEEVDGGHYTFAANRPNIEAGGERIRIAGRSRYEIIDVDYPSSEVRVTEPLGRAERLVGQVAIIRGHGHSAAYTVAGAKGQVIRFEGPAITGMCIAEGVEDNSLTTHTALSGYTSQLTARNLAGMALVTEDMTEASPLVGCTSDKDGTHLEIAEPCAFDDANGDGRCIAYFADFAPGYEIVFTPWLEAEAEAGENPRITSNRPFSN